MAGEEDTINLFMGKEKLPKAWKAASPRRMCRHREALDSGCLWNGGLARTRQTRDCRPPVRGPTPSALSGPPAGFAQGMSQRAEASRIYPPQ